MEKDVVCGVRYAGRPGQGGRYQPAQREDVLLLLEGVQDEVRCQPLAIREVVADGGAPLWGRRWPLPTEV